MTVTGNRDIRVATTSPQAKPEHLARTDQGRYAQPDPTDVAGWPEVSPPAVNLFGHVR